VPNDALDPAFWTLLEPGIQLLEGHRWRVSDGNAPMWHQAVNGLLLSPQSCLNTMLNCSLKGDDERRNFFLSVSTTLRP